MKTWLTDYLEYTKDQESPTIFHFWAGLSVIAGVVGRDVWLDRREKGVTIYRIFPGQLMVTLVAGSGFARKSTAVGLAEQLMKTSKVNIIPNKLSTEGFLKYLQNIPAPSTGTRISTGFGNAVATIVEDELSVLLSRRTYSEDIIDLLMKLYDAKDQFRYYLANKPEVELSNVCITMLSATTPVSLGEAIPARAHSAGFLSRVVFVYSGRSDKVNPLTDVDDEDIDHEALRTQQALYASLLDRLHLFRGLRGRFVFTPDGRKWFDAWYKQYVHREDTQGEGWPSRRHDHLLRVAMLLRISAYGHQPGNALVLDEDVLVAADNALKPIEAVVHKALACIGQATTAKNQDLILEFFRRQGGRATLAAVFAHVGRRFNDKRELVGVIDLLVQGGELIYEGTTGQDQWFRLGV